MLTSILCVEGISGKAVPLQEIKKHTKQVDFRLDLKCINQCTSASEL